MKKIALLAATLLALAVTSTGVTANEAYPRQPLKIFVTTPPGGTTDPLVRLLASKAEGIFGQPIVVENRVGGLVGSTAANALLASPPDGYTAILQTSALVISPWLLQLPYDVNRLEPVIKTSETSYVFTVGIDSPFKTYDDLIGYAKKNPGKLSCSMFGVGTLTHLPLLLLMKEADVSIEPVPYKGSVQAYPDLRSGRLDCSVEPVPGLLQFIGEGATLRPLAITQKEPWARFPDVVPLGAKYPNLSIKGWGGLFVAKGTPPEIIRKLHSVFAQAMRDPELIRKLTDVGLYAPVESTADFAATIEQDRKKFGEIIRASGIKVDQQK